MTQNKRITVIKGILYNILGSAILAFGLYNVHSFSGVTEGGILGLTLLLDHHFEISPALSGFILNFLSYAIGLRVLGKSFIAYSAVAGGSFSLFYAVFEKFPTVFPKLVNYPLAAAIIGAVFVGIGIGICVRYNGAPGGDDALAMSISKLTGFKITAIYLISDLTVLALSLTYIPIKRLMYSLLTVVLSGQIIGWIKDMKLPTSAKRS